MYFIDRGSYISNNNNSHCFDSISQLPGKKRGLQRATFPRAQEGVGGGGGGGGSLGAGRESQAGRSQVSRHRDRSTQQQPRAPCGPTHTLLQIYHSPNATLVLLRAAWAWHRLGFPTAVPRAVPGLCPRARGGDAWLRFGPTKDASLSLSSSSCPMSIPVAWTWLSFPPLDSLLETPEVSTPPVTPCTSSFEIELKIRSVPVVPYQPQECFCRQVLHSQNPSAHICCSSAGKWG